LGAPPETSQLLSQDTPEVYYAQWKAMANQMGQSRALGRAWWSEIKSGMLLGLFLKARKEAKTICKSLGCLSDCASVLNRRKVSVHFCIDGDGTIYQILDTQHGAWHASLNKANRESIGVEINNAYYLKYQKEYVKQGLGERPLQENGIVHGRTLKKFTWFYDAQIQALRALWGAIHEQHGIPLDYPKDEKGDFCTTVHQGCRDASFEGFCNHYNMVDRKIDCAGLDLPNLLNFINF
jgi:hypothetical protein